MSQYYKVVSGTSKDIRAFEVEVEDWLLKGWKLEGGVSVAYAAGDPPNEKIFSQALTLDNSYPDK